MNAAAGAFRHVMQCLFTDLCLLYRMVSSCGHLFKGFSKRRKR